MRTTVGANPEIPRSDVEMTMARHTVWRAIYVGPVLIALFWLIRGWDGAWSAAVGVAVVVVNFLLAGAILSISARISLSAYHAAALLGFFLRLGLLTLTMLLIAEFAPIDRLAFGITAVVTYLVLIGAEMVAMTRGKERELEWT
ncbi:MAG TPA: ATP synthase subunit I [Acidimicrobiia bacterium]|nr:ATP synthase subunit I [Acidimicrobiia bacterium]